MQSSPEKVSRKVFPRWRQFKDTPATEVSSIQSRAIDESQFFADADLEAKWIDNPGVVTATELVSAATIFGASDESRKAERFLRHNEQISTGLKRFVSVKKKAIADSPDTESDIKRRIAILKRRLYEFPRNAVLRVELARLYASIGQIAKADTCINLALNFGGNNRYIVRCAVRFFVHEKDLERAFYILNRANDKDPWILAAHVSVGHSLKAKQSKARLGQRLLETGIAPAHLTELAAALGTLEVFEGHAKRGKKYLKQSAEMPNDNAVAQLRWLHEAHAIDFDENLLNTQLSYEARAGHSMMTGEWVRSLSNCKLWMNDEPFSVRPAEIATYVATEFLKDYDTAIWFAERALSANPHDAGLLNNLAVAFALKGDIVLARENYKNASIYNPNRDRDPVLKATEGLIAYRSGNVQAGTIAYEAAMRLALEQNQRETAQRVIIHWLKEFLEYSNELDAGLATKIHNFFTDEKRAPNHLRQAYKVHLAPLISKSHKDEMPSILNEKLNWFE